LVCTTIAMTTPHHAQLPAQAHSGQQSSLTGPNPHQFDAHGRPMQLVFVNNPQAAHDHRHFPDFQPGIDPVRDPTIAQVEMHTEPNVAALMQAFYDISNHKDLDTFTQARFCDRTDKDAFPSRDVEAACRILHQKLVERCRYGYSGFPSKNRLDKSQSGESKKAVQQDDRSGNCKVRFDNVLSALRDWKSICVEIMYSDTFITNFVNAPATVVRDKRVQQSSNVKKSEKNKKRKAADQARKASDIQVALSESTIIGGPTVLPQTMASAQLGRAPPLSQLARPLQQPFWQQYSTAAGSLQNGATLTTLPENSSYESAHQHPMSAHQHDLANTPQRGAHNQHTPVIRRQGNESNHQNINFRDLHYNFHHPGGPIDSALLSVVTGASNAGGSSFTNHNIQGPGFENGRDAEHPGSGNTYIPDDNLAPPRGGIPYTSPPPRMSTYSSRPEASPFPGFQPPPLNQDAQTGGNGYHSYAAPVYGQPAPAPGHNPQIGTKRTHEQSPDLEQEKHPAGRQKQDVGASSDQDSEALSDGRGEDSQDGSRMSGSAE
jgi:hypothetical protein